MADSRTKKNSRLKAYGRTRSTAILEIGQEDFGYEVTAIDEKTAHVTLRQRSDGGVLDLNLELAPSEELAKRTLHFQSARLADLLGIYQMFSECTVIRSFPVTNVVLSLKTGASLSSPKVLEILDAALASKGVVMKRRGGKFVFAVRSNQVNLLASILDPPEVEMGLPAEDIIKPRLLKFSGEDSSQVLEYYAELSRRTVLVSRDLRGGNITVANQTQLTRKEAVWLMNAVFLLADVVMVPESDHFVFAVRPSQANDLPTFDTKASQAKAKSQSQPGLMSLRNVDGRQLLDAYASVLGRQALPMTSPTPMASVSFRTQKEISHAEIIFALEALAYLNNCRFELVGDDKVQILPATSARK